MSFKFPLATETWDQSELDAMQSVISSGRFAMGKYALTLSGSLLTT